MTHHHGIYSVAMLANVFLAHVEARTVEIIFVLIILNVESPF